MLSGHALTSTERVAVRPARWYVFPLLATAILASLLTVALPAGAARTPPAATRAALAASHGHPHFYPALAAAHARQAHRHFYRVHRGDTLTSIARREYGHASRWPALWWVNKRHVHNPNMLRVGQRLRLSAWHPAKPWLAAKAIHAIPKPPPPPPVVVTSYSAASSTSSSPAASTTYSAQPAQSYSGGSSFEQCVIARESGGNSQIMNSTGHYGLYQFSASTWAGYGGNPADFGHASAAEQRQVFDNAMSSPGGASNWAPYDGCAP